MLFLKIYIIGVMVWLLVQKGVIAYSVIRYPYLTEDEVKEAGCPTPATAIICSVIWSIDLIFYVVQGWTTFMRWIGEKLSKD